MHGLPGVRGDLPGRRRVAFGVAENFQSAEANSVLGHGSRRCRVVLWNRGLRESSGLLGFAHPRRSVSSASAARKHGAASHAGGSRDFAVVWFSGKPHAGWKAHFYPGVINFRHSFGGAVAQLGARLDGIEEVVGSNPIGSTNTQKVRPGDMGDRSYRTHRLHFWAKRVVERLQSFFLQIDVAEIVLHKADQPNPFFDFFDAHGLSGKDRAEIDFFAMQTDASAVGDVDGLVVERISKFWQSVIAARGGSVDFRGALHVQGLMRPLVVELL